MTTPAPYAGKLGPEAEVIFEINPIAWQRMTRLPTGMVARDLRRRAELVRHAAYDQIRPGHASADFENAQGKVSFRNQNLRETLRVKMAYTDWQPPVAFVGSTHPIALLHHEGTAPHTIVPRRARILAFPDAMGQMVFTKMVHHPGTMPNRYLTDNIHLALH